MASDPTRHPARTRGRLERWWWLAGLAISVVVVMAASAFASSDPDGLERVAEDKGFIAQAENFFEGLLADYAIPGVDNAWLASVLSGLLGVAIVFAVILVLGRLIARRRG